MNGDEYYNLLWNLAMNFLDLCASNYSSERNWSKDKYVHITIRNHILVERAKISSLHLKAWQEAAPSRSYGHAPRTHRDGIEGSQVYMYQYSLCTCYCFVDPKAQGKAKASLSSFSPQMVLSTARVTLFSSS